jgi:hypothetical protein
MPPAKGPISHRSLPSLQASRRKLLDPNARTRSAIPVRFGHLLLFLWRRWRDPPPHTPASVLTFRRFLSMEPTNRCRSPSLGSIFVSATHSARIF